jgi:hypothetical protein
MSRLPTSKLPSALALCLGLCWVLAFPALASAGQETVNFDDPGLPANKPIEQSTEAAKISFPADPGYRPYPVNVGTSAAKSGAFVGDVGRCVQEAEETGHLIECEFPQAGTTAFLSETAKSVTLFAGSFGPEQKEAKLTAFDSDGNVVAEEGPKPISRQQFKTFLEAKTPLNSPANIASFRIEAFNADGTVRSGDLGIDELQVEFVGGGAADFSMTTTTQVVPVVQGQTAEIPVHVSRLNGLGGPIEVTAEELPPGVSVKSTARLQAGETTGSIHLEASPSAPDTDFVPTDAKLVASSVNTPALRHTAPFQVRVAQDFKLSSGTVGEEEGKKVLVEVPQCAPVDVPIKIARDIAMRRDVNLTVREDGGGDGGGEVKLPPGISAEILPGSDVAPGGNLTAERTLRLSADGGSALAQGPIPLLLEGSDDPNAPSRQLQLLMVPVQGAKVATTAVGSGNGYTPRFQKEGSTAQVHGLGFCPGTKVEVGNDRATVPAKLINDHTVEFSVPRPATSGPVTIVPPGRLPSYRTEDSLTVDSVRNTNGFKFPNYAFHALSLDEFSKAFGTDEVFESLNPCWPFGDCSFSTGVIDPVAAIDWGWMNLALRGSGGHCVGIVLASQELSDGRVKYREVADTAHFGAQSPFELADRSGPYPSLDDFLDSEHAKQYSDQFLSARFTRSHSMSSQIVRLEQEFSHGHMPMVTLQKSLGAGHAVVAYDLERTPEFDNIYVYDSKKPFTESEELAQADSSEHFAGIDLSIIRVNKRTGTWSYPVPTAEGQWQGSNDDGSLWVVPFETVPKDPSLPGAKSLAGGVASLASLAIGSADDSVQAGKGSNGAQFMPSDENPETPGSDGLWMSQDLKHPLSGTVVGVKTGSYTEAYSSPGFVASVSDVATAKGVSDQLSGVHDSLSFDSGKARPLDLELARRSSPALSEAASLHTDASAHGTDSAGLSGGGALTYAHDGAPTTVSFSLTAMRRNGGGSTFLSAPIAVRGGDRLRVVPLGRELKRVRLVVRHANGPATTRILRSRGRAPGRLKLGAAKISGGKLSLRYKLSGFAGGAVIGAVLRLKDGTHLIAHKAIALKAANGSGKVVWELPSGVKAGTYRLAAELRAVTVGARGSTVSGSVLAHRTATVRVH